MPWRVRLQQRAARGVDTVQSTALAEEGAGLQGASCSSSNSCTLSTVLCGRHYVRVSQRLLPAERSPDGIALPPPPPVQARLGNGQLHELAWSVRAQRAASTFL